VRGAAGAPSEVVRLGLRSGRATTGSELARELGRPEALQTYVSHIEYCKDVLYLAAVNPNGAGVAIIAPLKEITTLSRHESRQWQMLAAHIEAAHRLREGIALKEEEQGTAGDFPLRAEAVLDARNFRVTDAAGAARRPTASQRLREAAVAIDRARGRMRKTDPRKALEGWKALIHGRWSVVDWFDTDGRRFVLAIPNAPEITDPRGLTTRESQVAWMAAAGMTNKVIAYRLGLSTSRISLVLRSAMRKLGVRTRTQLAHKIGDLPSPKIA